MLVVVAGGGIALPLGGTADEFPVFVLLLGETPGLEDAGGGFGAEFLDDGVFDLAGEGVGWEG